MSAGSPFTDPLLTDLLEAYRGEDLLLFAGTGVSAAAGLPSPRGLVELLAARAALGPDDFGAQVEKLLDDKGNDVPALATAIAALAPCLRGVLSTSVDHLLERAFKGAWPAFTEVTGPVVRRRHYILKLHGTLSDRASWVFTRDEHERAMYADPKLQTAFYAVFHGSPVLFVGYGLGDDDLDQVVSRVRAFAGEQPPRRFALVAEETITPDGKARMAESGVELIPYANPDGKHGEAVRILDWLAAS